MKYTNRIIYLSILSIILFSFSSTINSISEVKYFIGSRFWANEPIRYLSYNVLQAIASNRINAYEPNSDKLINRDSIEKELKPLADYHPLNKEEIAIAIWAGDYSVMENIDTKYSPEELHKLSNNGKNITNLFEIKIITPFEVKELLVEIDEFIEHDNKSKKLSSSIKYLNFIIPKQFTHSENNKILFRINFNDLKSVNLKKEYNYIKNKEFRIEPQYGDITIIDEQNNQSKLSDIKNLDSPKLNNSIFNAYKNNICL